MNDSVTLRDYRTKSKKKPAMRAGCRFQKIRNEGNE